MAAAVVPLLGVGPQASGAQPHGVVATNAAALAGGWLTEQFLDQVEIQSYSDGVFHTDDELTADVILGLDAAKVGQTYAYNATYNLIGDLGNYVGDGTNSSFAGPLAKTILVAEAQGLDPRSFGGRDLIAALETLQDPSSGRFSDKSATGDHSDAVSQSLAVIAERRAGRPGSVISNGLRSLGTLQCGNGGFSSDYGQADCLSDSIATSMAVLAGIDQTAHTATWNQVGAAVTYLSSKQFNGNGMVAGLSTEDAVVVNSLAAAAFAAAGVTGSATPPLSGALGAAQFVGTLQRTYDQSPAYAGWTGDTEDADAIAIFGLAIFDDPAAKLSYETVSHYGQNDAPIPAAPMGSFEPMRPFRVLDTRLTAPIPAGGTLELLLPIRVHPADPDQYGFPGDFSAAALNVTALSPAAPGYVAIYPSGTPQPATSVLSLTPGVTSSANTLVTIGEDHFPGGVSIYNGSSRPLQLVLDATGFIQGGLGRASGTYRSIVPTRLIDTRKTVRIHAGADLTVPLSATIVNHAEAAAVTVTAVNPHTAGYLTAWGLPAFQPQTSTLNFTAGQTVSNGVIVGNDGNTGFRITNHSAGDVDVIVDMTGYFVSGRPILPGTYIPISPIRLIDTRKYTPIPAGVGLALPAEGAAGLPDPGVLAVAANLTAISPAGTGYLIADPNYGVRVPPLTSTLNVTPSATVANGALTGVGTDGAIAIYNQSNRPVNAALDINGYFRSLPQPPFQQ